MRHVVMKRLRVPQPILIGNEGRVEGRWAGLRKEDMGKAIAKWFAAGCAATALGLSGASAMNNAAPKPVDVKRMKGAAMIEYAARPYIQFRQDIDFVADGTPGSAEEMREVHLRLASHDNRSMAGSWIAYAAMIAADSPSFAASIEDQIAQKGKKAFVAELETNPALVRNLPGADQAIAAIMTFAASDAEKIRQAGDSYIAEAYDMQKLAWARRTIAESGMERVDAALKFAATREWPRTTGRKVVKTDAGTVRPDLVSYASWSTDWAGETAAVSPSARPGVIVTKALVLGAHYAMNTAEQQHMAAFATSKKSERCFTNAKLNLDQCIAATRTPYEEAFCLGQHALNDMSSCVGWPAGVGASGS